MLFEKFTTPGLSHYSYLIADSSEALIIDPRTDCDIYIKMALKNDLRIVYILETHCHEDFIVGSTLLSKQTGAEIWHADSQSEYSYGFPVFNAQTWKVGNLKIESFHTPGHTSGSMSYLLYDEHGVPWVIFTGDTLFSNGVGRVDLQGDEKTHEMSLLLYDSIFSKLLLFGDQIIVCPAHGAGSSCGKDISNRTWTTIGLERLHNPMLQFIDESSFTTTVSHRLEKPPYFNKMKSLNTSGQIPEFKKPVAYAADQFSIRSKDSLIIDTRDVTSFATSHIPNSLSIWEDGISKYAGWFIPYDISLFLIVHRNRIIPISLSFHRLGYQIDGYLSDDFIEWHKTSLPTNSISTLTVQKFHEHIKTGENLWILDVRNSDEIAKDSTFNDSHQIPVTQLTEQIDTIPIDRSIYIFCGSGLRSMMAASILIQQGPYRPVVILGGFSGLQKLSI